MILAGSQTCLLQNLALVSKPNPKALEKGILLGICVSVP